MSVKKELDNVISELKNQGITLNNYQEKAKLEGLGDVVEKVLSKFGISEDRIKTMTGIKNCGCKERKRWLNEVFPFRKKDYRLPDPEETLKTTPPENIIYPSNPTILETIRKFNETKR